MTTQQKRQIKKEALKFLDLHNEKTAVQKQWDARKTSIVSRIKSLSVQGK